MNYLSTEMTKSRDNIIKQTLDGTVYSPDERKRVLAELDKAATIWGQLAIDKERLQKYAVLERKTYPREDVAQVYKLRAAAKVSLEGMPMPGDTKLNEIGRQVADWYVQNRIAFDKAEQEYKKRADTANGKSR